MTYIKIGGIEYPARVIGYAKDPAWGNRESRGITLEMSHADAEFLFRDGIEWSVITKRGSYEDKDGEIHTLPDIEQDMSSYDLAGAITDNRDGTVTVKMGKYTPDEVLSVVVGISGSARVSQTKTLRAAVETGAQSLDDATASLVPFLLRSMRYDGSLIEAGVRIGWGGVVKRAATALWDTSENDPNHAPDLWEDISYRDGIRIIPNVITAGLAFSEGEKGWWGDTLMVSKLPANTYTPEQYAAGWEVYKA